MKSKENKTDSNKLSEDELSKVSGGDDIIWYGTNDMAGWCTLVKMLVCPHCGWTQSYHKGDKSDRPNICPKCGNYGPIVKEMYDIDSSGRF